MKIYFIVIFLFLFLGKSPLSFSQNNLELYYKYVNKAELAIINKDYNKATLHYHKAFAKHNIPSSIDIYNNIVANIMSNKLDNAIKYCYQLAQYQVGETFFKNKNTFNLLKSLPAWDTFINNIDNIEAKYKYSSNKISNILDSLITIDQDAHTTWFQSNKDHSSMQKMYEVDSITTKSLFHLFNTYGYLSEDKIGATIYNDTVLLFYPKFSIIILHAYQNRNMLDTTFNNILRKELYEGNVTPAFFAFVQDGGSHRQERIYYGSTLYNVFKGNLYKTKDHIHVNSLNKKKYTYRTINKHRQDIYLCSLKDLERKIIYNINNPMSEFRILGYYNNVQSFGNIASEQEFYRNSIFIKNLNNQ